VTPVFRRQTRAPPEVTVAAPVLISVTSCAGKFPYGCQTFPLPLSENCLTKRYCADLSRVDSHFVLFSSSHGIGSHSSTLLPSGSRIHANFPFSWDSGPFKMSTPFRFSCANISDMLSIR
jgi:hypothetical protein